MSNLLSRIVVTAFSLILVANFVPGIHVDSIWTSIVAAIALGVVNVLIRPILVVLTLPVTILTLGLFLFVINAYLFWSVATFIDGFTVDGFRPALIGSLIVSLVSAIVNRSTD